MAILSDLKRTRDIKYISRDFDALVTDLKTYLQNQFPNTYQDFSDTSGGMAFLELVAYVGDILNFYIDKQFNELFLNSAQERKSVVSLAKNLGYVLRGKSASTVLLTITATYPVTGSSTAGVDFTLVKGSQITTNNGVTFETVQNIDFGSISSRVITQNISQNTTTVKVPNILAVNGVTKVFQTSVINSVPYLRIKLPDPDVLEVISVSSSDGNTWYQADYLAQESQFFGVPNTNSSSASVPYILSLRQIPRRFVLEKDENSFSTLTFGSGALTVPDADFIPNPYDFLLPTTLRGVSDGFLIQPIDPQNFINTGTLGATPANTTLTIIYRTGGGIASNITSGLANSFFNKLLTFDNINSASASQQAQVSNTLTVTNPLPASGGIDEETNIQIREYASRSFAAQNRVVTLQDYIARTLSMPPAFGAPFRVQAQRDPFTDYGVQLAIITQNSDSTLATASKQLKLNIGTYLNRFKPLNDYINVVDGLIINVGLNFQIVADASMNSQQVLANCLLKLQDYFKNTNWQMGQSISISYIQSLLHSVGGVLAVGNVSFDLLQGIINGNFYYSNPFNIKAFTKNNVIVSQPNYIFEVRYPQIDIRGSLLN